MKLILLIVFFPFLMMACREGSTRSELSHTSGNRYTFRLYSKYVSDSFTIFVNLPNEYKKQQSEKYPVVYLLDANLYFDIVATILDKYADVGLAPSVILVV